MATKYSSSRKRTRRNKKQRPDRKIRNSSDGGGIFGFLVLALLVYFVFFREQDLPESYEEQIAALNNAETQIKHLTTFIRQQRDDLIQREMSIAELESERKSLEPMVKADRATVASILDAQVKHRVWGNRVEGIIFSLVAMLLWHGISWLWSRRWRAASEASSE